MREAECSSFETEMAADSQLKETVELQRLLVNEIKQRAFIAEIIKETKTHKPKRIQFRKVMIITWSAAAIFIGAFFVNQAFVNNRMDNLYSQYYANPEVDVMRGDVMRGIDTNETDFWQAMKLLDKNQPKQAQEILQKLYQFNDNFTYYEDVRWYLALTELKLHHRSEAKKYLNELIDSEFYGEKVNKLLEEL